MAPCRSPLRLWHLCVASSLVGCMLESGDFDVARLAALLITALALLVTVAAASPPNRTVAACWFISFYPAMAPVYARIAWMTAWNALGHRPIYYVDDPHRVGTIVDIPVALTHLALSVWPLSVLAVLALLRRRRRMGAGIGALTAVPLAWLLAVLATKCDPASVFEWLLD
jgi:hypothetical protein